MKVNRPLIQPNQIPEPAQGQPITFEFLVDAHRYLMTIPPAERSEPIRKAIEHLEGQISKVIMTINLRVGPPL